MEAKKNPDKDLTRKSGQFFLIGLSISISLMITAFEWRTEVIQIVVDPGPPEELTMLIDIPITTIDLPKPREISFQKTEIKIAEIVPTESSGTLPTEIITTDDPISVPSPAVVEDDKEPLDNDIHIFAEVQPQPEGGLENFYKQLSKNIKYPNPARRMGIEGKVYVEFVVNKNGDPTDFKISKGIGAGCDEEAIRVIASTKWRVGKQRGIPVRVRMVMPVYFKLD